MADEKKLGPKVTYTNPDGDAGVVTIAGVALREGQGVDLVERLGESRAAEILKKLAGNRLFKVDGGPDHEAEAKKREQAEAKDAELRQKDADEARKEAEANYKAPEHATLEQPAAPRPARR